VAVGSGFVVSPDNAAFLERLGRLHARLPLQSEDAGELVRRMRDGDRY